MNQIANSSEIALKQEEPVLLVLPSDLAFLPGGKTAEDMD